jgi:hypothetical protein
MIGGCTTNGVKRNAYRVLMGRPDGKEPRGIHRSKWKDNIKMYLRQCESVSWLTLAQNKDHWWTCVKTVKKKHSVCIKYRATAASR